MNRELDFGELLKLFKDESRIVILVTLLSTLVGAIISFFFLTPIYQARTDLLISQSVTGKDSNTLSPGEIESNIKLIESYQFIVKSQRVLDKTAEASAGKYSTKQLSKMVKVETNGNSQIISIIVENPNKTNAAKIANSVANIFQLEIKNLMNLDNVHILSEAIVDKDAEPVRPDPILNSLIALLIGLITSIGIIFFKSHFQAKIQTQQDIKEHLKLPALGEIPIINNATHLRTGLKNERYSKMVALFDQRSPITESYRSIRTNVQFLKNFNEIKVMMFTSNNPGEGKSVTGGNLAILMAMEQKKTVFVDADLRKPNGHMLFNVPNRIGVTSYLSGNASLDQIIVKTDVPNMNFIAAGPIPPNPSELVSSIQMDQLLNELKMRFDVIILDCPPMIVSDATILASKVDGCILIINAQKNRREEIKHRVEQLQQVNTKLLGVILNKSKIKFGKNDYY